MREVDRIKQQNNFILKDICDKYDLLKIKPNKYILCDIDGTIANMLDRNPFKSSRIFNDCKITPVIDMLKAFQAQDYKVIFVSGRSDDYEEITRDWIKNVAQVDFENIFMRKTNDNRSDEEVKKEIYETHIKDKYDVAFVVDDRPRVVKLWRSLGFFVFNVDQSGLDF